MAIASIQRGTIAFDPATSDYETATISSVDVDKSVVRWLGSVGRAAGTVNDAAVWIYLSDATTVAAQRYHDGGGTLGTVSFEVIEYT